MKLCNWCGMDLEVEKEIFGTDTQHHCRGDDWRLKRVRGLLEEYAANQEDLDVYKVAVEIDGLYQN